MQPLPRKTRRIYLALLVLVFVVLVPATVLYSTGYRLGEGFSLVKTGGIYIGVGESGAELLLDGRVRKKVGILKNGFFVQDLTPRVYYVRVEKEGYRPWEKILEVNPQRVSEAAAFILPEHIPYVEVLPSDSKYEDLLDLFATSTATTLQTDEYPDELATSTHGVVREVKRKGDVVLWQEEDGVYARWVNSVGRAPSYFCEERVCNKVIHVKDQTVDFFDFHPQSNELLITVSDGVAYMTEIDPRIPRNTQTLFDATGMMVRTKGASIYFKEPTGTGFKIFEYEL
ncbi:MAG: hypothetical protein OQJ98_01250 [Candidatus Pacebacteria bacterium]|nr:hypothetical protein [Candidatus Paceibacterota bacterium]